VLQAAAEAAAQDEKQKKDASSEQYNVKVLYVEKGLSSDYIFCKISFVWWNRRRGL
jgi:hypothetical protein